MINEQKNRYNKSAMRINSALKDKISKYLVKGGYETEKYSHYIFSGTRILLIIVSSRNDFPNLRNNNE